MKKLERESKLLETYGVAFYAEFFMSSVDPKWRGQGLATEMYERSVSLLRAQGFPLVKSSFTSPITRKIATKMGFKELARLYLLDETDEFGLPAFPNASPAQFVANMALQL
jgi:GNAT superfamily N-acetyltransferase